MSYSAPPPSAPYAQPAVDPALYAWFNAIDKEQTGFITDKMLVAALSKEGAPMDRAAAGTLISMFDNSGMGKISFTDFPNLHKFISDHTMIFNQHDMDRDGVLIVAEAQSALVRLGFALDDAVFRTVLQRFDPELKGRFTFPLFMEVAIFLGNLRRLFGFYDKEHAGKITLDMSTFCMAAVNIVGSKTAKRSKKEGKEGKKHHSKRK